MSALGGKAEMAPDRSHRASPCQKRNLVLCITCAWTREAYVDRGGRFHAPEGAMTTINQRRTSRIISFGNWQNCTTSCCFELRNLDDRALRNMGLSPDRRSK